MTVLNDAVFDQLSTPNLLADDTDPALPYNAVRSRLSEPRCPNDPEAVSAAVLAALRNARSSHRAPRDRRL